MGADPSQSARAIGALTSAGAYEGEGDSGGRR